MIESVGSGDAGEAPLSAGRLAGWVDRLAGVDTAAPDADLIDQITELERLKSACAAAQAALTVAFVASQTDGLTAARAKDERVRRSINGQVALARRESPVRGGRHVGLATALIREMPNAYTALRAGQISEWRATLLVRETACLSADDRRTVDRELAGRLAGLGDRETAQAAARIAQRLDPEQCVARHRKAVGDRRVSIRPAPDTMTYLTALLPVAHGVGVYAALTRSADTAKATGDARSRGQLMADELVTLITNPNAQAGTATHTRTPAGHPTVGRAPVDQAPADQAPAGQTTVDQAPADEAPASQTAVDHAPVCQARDRPGQMTADHPDRPGATPDPDRRDDHADLEPASRNSANPEPIATNDRADDATDAGTDDRGAAASDVDRADADTTGTEAAHTVTADTALGCVPAGVNLDIHLVMTDRTLFDGDTEPAILTGYGPIPAPLARQLVRDAGPDIKAWIRRLYTDPDTGHLISGDTHRRTFPERRPTIPHRPRPDLPHPLVRRPDPARRPHHPPPDGGPTHINNGQGLCERCNYTKQTPGWTSHITPDGTGILITTPTGHTTRSDPPPPPRSPSWDLDAAIERRGRGVRMRRNGPRSAARRLKWPAGLFFGREDVRVERQCAHSA